jgi:hypothetical protein
VKGLVRHNRGENCRLYEEMKRIFRNAEDGEADSHWNLKERGGSFAPPSLSLYIFITLMPWIIQLQLPWTSGPTNEGNFRRLNSFLYREFERISVIYLRKSVFIRVYPWFLLLIRGLFPISASHLPGFAISHSK